LIAFKCGDLTTILIEEMKNFLISYEACNPKHEMISDVEI